MRYTLWHRDTLVGETNFGFGLRAGSRAGVLHPTSAGMAVLPALTAMAPALFAAEEAMQRLPLSDEEIERDVDGVLEAFTASPEGKRVLRAAEEMAALELRDPSGRLVPFDSILVSDVHEMAALGAVLSQGKADGSDPVRYVISATFSTRRRGDMAAVAPH